MSALERRASNPQDDGRYRLLETLRQYGAHCLADALETEPTRERHSRHFLALVERVSPGLDDARLLAIEAALTAELDNLRACADWCVAAEWGVELAEMCDRLRFFFFTSVASVDGAAWYQALIDHRDALDEQVVVDSLGVLAVLHAGHFGNFKVGAELSDQSRAMAEAGHLDEPPWAWLAATFAAMFTGDHVAARDASARAVSAAEARGDERVALIALSLRTASTSALEGFDRAVEDAMDTLERAERLGQPTLIAASVSAAASVHFTNPQGPDFASALEVLASHPIAVSGGAMNEMWLDITRATAEVGLALPGAVERLARAARASDRLQSAHTLDQSLRLLAIVAAEEGLDEHALALVTYTDAHLRQYRTENPQQTWAQERLDQLLAGTPPRPPGADITRGDIMRRINEIEVALAHDPARVRRA